MENKMEELNIMRGKSKSYEMLLKIRDSVSCHTTDVFTDASDAFTIGGI